MAMPVMLSVLHLKAVPSITVLQVIPVIREFVPVLSPLPVLFLQPLLQQDKVLPGVPPMFQEEPDHIPIPGGGIPAYPEEMHL